MREDPFQLGSNIFGSRLLLGSGRFSSFELMRSCHKIAETEIVTVAMRRLDTATSIQKNILSYIDSSKITLLPNTSGVQTAEEVLYLADLVVSMGMHYLKIEVIYETKILFPDPIETLRAVKLVREKYCTKELFIMVYTNDDPILSMKLVDAGADCIMPGGSPIGSGRGLVNTTNLSLIQSMLGSKVPLILDAGIGSGKDVVEAMELGFDGVLLNSAIAYSKNPGLMAKSMKYAIKSGRFSYLSGRMDSKIYGTSSSV